MSTFSDDTDAALAAERGFNDAALLTAEGTIDDLRRANTGLTDQLSALRDEFDAYKAAHPDGGGDPTPADILLGSSMSKWPGHRGVAWQSARCYNKGQADDAIAQAETGPGSRLNIDYSPTDISDTASAVTAELQRVSAAAKAKGVETLTVHFATDNEADRHFGNLVGTGQPSIQTWVDKQKAVQPAVHAVPGCKLYGNFTRDGIGKGRNDKFAAGFQYLDGFAINCYNTGMDQAGPPDYDPWPPMTDPMLAWVAKQGVKEYACWETGNRSDPNRPNGRPDSMAAFPPAVIASADKVGVTVTTLDYWDSVTTPQRDSRFETDGTLTRDAWRGALT